MKLVANYGHFYLVLQLQLPFRNEADVASHQRWLTAQSLVFASLGRYTNRFGQLYGAQFHVDNSTSQELLSGEYISEKLLVLWDTLARLRAAAPEHILARYVVPCCPVSSTALLSFLCLRLCLHISGVVFWWSWQLP